MNRWMSLAMLLLAAPAVQAEEGYVTVVTGSRTERRAADAAVNTEVIDRRELRLSGATDLSRALDGHSGVSIDRSFRGAGLRLQGFDPKHVLVLVDGERIAGTLGGTLDLSRLRLEDVERVEIVKGAASALYGTDAMAGVVNLVPRRCASSTVEGRALGTSLAQVDLSGLAALGNETVCARLSGSFRRGPTLQLGTPGPATVIDGLLSADLGARLEWQPSEEVRVMASVQGAQADSDGVDASATGAVYDRLSRTQSIDATLRPEYHFEDGSRMSLSLRQSWFRHQLRSDQRHSDELDQYQDTHARIWHATSQYERTLGDLHALTVGLEGHFESLQSPRLESGTGSRLRGSLYAQDEWQVSQKRRLQLVPGVRFDADRQFGSRVSPRLAARWDVLDKVSLRTSVGFGFRAASFQELLLRFENTGVGYVVEGNPDLRPERSRSAQAGVQWQPHSKVAVTVDGFFNDVDDLIASTTLPRTSSVEPTRYGYLNVDRARLSGAEAGVRLRLVKGLRLDVAYSFWHALDLTRQRPLEGRPSHRATLRAGWEHRPWGLEAGANATWVGQRPVYLVVGDTETATHLPSYALVDLRVSKTLWRRLSLIAGVDNLLNSGDPLDLPIQPRTVYAGIGYRP